MRCESFGAVVKSRRSAANYAVALRYGGLRRIAHRKRLCILLVGMAPLLLRALLLPLFHRPEPRIHDEFSYLLAADTFAHGRLANPQHPMWVHFESMHILVRPAYASIFPIGQALAMAAGQVAIGDPWAGVWLSVALMGAALCWMLQGWVPPGWALLGSLLAVLRYGTFSYWMNSYFGGAVAAIGGALMLGALPRIVRRQRWQDAAWMGLGLAILANSRPFESLMFSLLIAGSLLVWMLGKGRPPARVAAWSIALPMVLILGATGAGMSYYFARVTGRPFLMPYVLYRRASTMAPHFIWQSPRPRPVYYHKVLRDFYTSWEMGMYVTAQSRNLLLGALERARSYWRFYFGPLLTIPLLTIPWLWKKRRSRFLLLATAIFFSLALVPQVWQAPHYAAPATGLAIALVIMGMRRMRLWRWHGRPAGLLAVRAVVLACALSFILKVGAGKHEIARNDRGSFSWAAPGNLARAAILRRLSGSPGRHLVFVRYTPAHDTGDEWVYNEAGIDAAKVVWVREMDPTSNANLLRYFHDRQVWLVEPDVSPGSLFPYRQSFQTIPFVRLGDDVIETLWSTETVKRRIFEKISATNYTTPYQFNCDQWNYFFTQATGVEPPEAVQDCFPNNNRRQIVSFDHWFSWIERQSQ